MKIKEKWKYPILLFEESGHYNNIGKQLSLNDPRGIHCFFITHFSKNRKQHSSQGYAQGKNILTI